MSDLQDGVDEAVEAIDPVRLRRALGGFPTGVTIVTARVGEQIAAMTANSFASVSLAPPLVAWCVAKKSPSHATFVEAEAYAVHFLGAVQAELALRFAETGADKLAGVAHRPGISGAPILDGLAPVFECRVWARYPGGDHTIMVGEVVRLTERQQDPLVFHSGSLRAMAGSQPGDDALAAAELGALLAEAAERIDPDALARLSAAEIATVRTALSLLTHGTSARPFDPHDI